MTLFPKERLQELLPEVTNIARKASTAILKVYGESDFQVTHKDDESPLTLADRQAHQVIHESLVGLTPDVPVVSEESNQLPWSVRSCWNSYWLVDPLDGTKEFIKRNGEFTVNIALIEANRPILGVVYIPVQDGGYIAARDVGAFRIDSRDNQTAITVRQCDRSSLVAVGSRSHMTEEVADYIERLGGADMHSIGSSLKLCLVAEGSADIYPRLGPTSEWDTAAAQCVAEQSGGAVVTCEGKPLLYNTKESFLNPYFLVYGDSTINWLEFLKPAAASPDAS